MTSASQPQQPTHQPTAASRVPPLPPPPPSGKLSFDDIAKYFSLPIAEAASNLGVCTSVLKRICRENGIIRWPYRKFLAGKTVEEIRKDAVRERTKDLAELSKTERQQSNVPKLVPSTSAGQSSSYGTQVQSRTLNVSQDSSKFQPGLSMMGHATQGSRGLQNGWSNVLQTNQTKHIPTYMDDFTFGFPTNGLSSVTVKWWGNTEQTTEEASNEESKMKKVEIEESYELSNDSSLCMLIDDQPDSDTEDSFMVTQPSALLRSVRRKAVEGGRESLKVTSKDCKPYKLGKRQKLLLLQIFGFSFPDQWKEGFS